MLSKQLRKASAEPASVEQPASARALAIPEILENVLKPLRPSGWKHVASVSKLWQGTVDALALGYVPNRTIFYNGRFNARFAECNRWTYSADYSVSGALRRTPQIGCRITRLHIGEPPLSDDWVQIIRTFYKLRYLSMCVAPAIVEKVSSAHERSPFAFHCLTYLSIYCRAGTADSVRGFLAALPALIKLRVIWLDLPLPAESEDAEGAHDEVASVLTSVPGVHHLVIRLPYSYDSTRLTKSLPKGLRTLEVKTGSEGARSLVADLVDARMLPDMCTLPILSTAYFSRPEASTQLKETWLQRKALRCPAYDQHMLRYWAGLTDEVLRWSDYSEESDPFAWDDSW